MCQKNISKIQSRSLFQGLLYPKVHLEKQSLCFGNARKHDVTAFFDMMECLENNVNRDDAITAKKWFNYHAKLVDKLVNAADDLKNGKGLEEGVFLGPVIRESNKERTVK